MKAFIPKDQWFEDKYARCQQLTNVYQFPATEQNNQLQTQAEDAEVVRVLGEQEGHYLIKKFDGTLGWVDQSMLAEVTPSDAVFKIHQTKDAKSFLREWRKTPYLWGGVTQRGVDCSGFIQRYYIEVRGVVLPKNSRDQRSLGQKIEVEDLQDEDLIFVDTQSGTHHVGIYQDRRIWHATEKYGVTADSVRQFLKTHKLGECRRLFSNR